jgi:hypothetical protein
MKKFVYVFLISALMIIGFSGTVMASSCPYDLSGMGAANKVVSFDRKNVVDNIYEYTIVLKVGPGEFDKIGIHRVVKETKPNVPAREDHAVMMVHGDTSDFDSAFMMSTLSGNVARNQSLGIFLAQQGIDVWGIDLRWTQVPGLYPGTEAPYCYASDCSFMSKWNTTVNLQDIKTAVKAARIVRMATGSGAGKIFLLGHSSGAKYTYAYANEETQIPSALRDIKGIIPIDMVYKFDPSQTDLIKNSCDRYGIFKSIRDSGKYYSDDALALKAIAALAAADPNGDSPVMPGFTNEQVALLALSATYATYTPPLTPPNPFYHYCAGQFSEEGIPTGLQFTSFSYMTDFAFAVPSFQSINDLMDVEALWCNNPAIAPSQYDDHLSKVKVPVFYVGAAGGIGSYGEYTLGLLGSADKTSNVVALYPPGYEAADYGHIDVLYAGNAKDLVWEPISSWINSR